MNIRLLISLCLSPALALAGIPNSVKTADGLISGVTLKSGVRAFKGIPFAAPPVENLRWKAPQPVIPWKGVRDSRFLEDAANGGIHISARRLGAQLLFSR